MPKKINSVKDIVWAVCILAALLALLVGLVYGATGHWYGDKTRPVMNIGHRAESGSAEKTGSGAGAVADGTLHTLRESGDTGQSYLDSLTIVADSAYAPLRGSALTAAAIWTSDSGSLPMSAYDSWRIVYPGDGSSVTIPNAATIAKPGLLVLAIGGDGAAGLSQEQFIALYENLISDILTASPQPQILVGPAASVTASYVGEGMSAQQAGQINEWLQQICIDTGAVWADWSGSLCDGGYLRPEFAEADGRTLNAVGLNNLCLWLRTHAAA